MRTMLLLLCAAGAMSGQGPVKTYTGVVTDTMCGANHSPMGIQPDAKCVRECVKMAGGKWKYALWDGKRVWTLSDQATPEKFAAQKVRVTGMAYEKTGILKVDKIEAAR